MLHNSQNVESINLTQTSSFEGMVSQTDLTRHVADARHRNARQAFSGADCAGKRLTDSGSGLRAGDGYGSGPAVKFRWSAGMLDSMTASTRVVMEPPSPIWAAMVIHLAMCS